MSNDELNEHRTYFDDAVKLSRYREAITATVRPGDVVLDLGAGTGLLGFLAAQAGASKVYAVDGGAIIAIVGELAKANGLDGVVTPIRAFSTQLELPEKVDVIVGDQLGGMGFDAGVNEYYADSARRLLRSGGKTIPERYVIGIAPAEAPEEYAAVEFWGERDGLDLRPLRSYAANSVRPVRFSGAELLGPTVPVVELETTEDVDIDVLGRLTITRAGVLHGLVGSFRATMSPGGGNDQRPSGSGPDAAPLAGLPTVGRGRRGESWRYRGLPAEGVSQDPCGVLAGVGDACRRRCSGLSGAPFDDGGDLRRPVRVAGTAAGAGRPRQPERLRRRPDGRSSCWLRQPRSARWKKRSPKSSRPGSRPGTPPPCWYAPSPI